MKKCQRVLRENKECHALVLSLFGDSGVLLWLALFYYNPYKCETFIDDHSEYIVPSKRAWCGDGGTVTTPIHRYVPASC